MANGKWIARTAWRSTRHFPFTIYHLPFAVVFVFLATVNSAGYRYGASDQAFYVPAVLRHLDPALFPADAALITSQARLTLTDETVAALARVTGASVPALFATLYVAALCLLAAGGWLIAGSLYRTRWAGLALLGALTIRHAIARSGTNTLEGYFHPRQLAFALGALAVAAFLRRSLPLAGVGVLAAGLVHPTTALWFAIWIGVAAVASDRRLRVPGLLAAVFAAIAAGWMLAAGPLQGRLEPMDAEWLATLATKNYLFPLEWPFSAWLLNLGYLPIVVWIFRRRRATGLTSAEERGLVAGALALVVMFLLGLPFNALRVQLAVQLHATRDDLARSDSHPRIVARTAGRPCRRAPDRE